MKAIANPNEWPATAAEMCAIEPVLARLHPDDESGCPMSKRDIHAYLKADAPAPYVKPDLFFGRTALIEGVRFWLWGFVERGRTNFVDVGAYGDEAIVGVGLGDGLTPEQFLALRYVRQWKPKLRRSHARRG